MDMCGHMRGIAWRPRRLDPALGVVVIPALKRGARLRQRGREPPQRCDLEHLTRTLDGLDPGELWSLVAAGMTRGEWVITAGHDIGAGGPQTLSAREIDGFCRRLVRDDRVWVAPLVEIAERVATTQAVRHQ